MTIRTLTKCFWRAVQISNKSYKQLAQEIVGEVKYASQKSKAENWKLKEIDDTNEKFSVKV